MLTLKQITHLNAIVQHKTIHRAAEILHITQPALTRSLHNLEEQLGVTLFHRSRSGMTPSEFCLVIKQRSQQLLYDAQDIEREAKLYNNAETGTLKVGVGRGAKELILREALPLFVVRYPRLQISVNEGKPEDLLFQLKNRQVDMCVTGLGSFTHVDGIKDEKIKTLSLVALVRPEHPLVGCGTISLSRIASYSLVSATNISHSHPLHNLIENSASGLSMINSVMCSDYIALQRIVLQTDNWLLAPYLQFAHEIERGELIQLTIEEFEPSIDLRVVELSGRSRAPAGEYFVQICRETLDRIERG